MTTTGGRVVGTALRRLGRRHRALGYCWTIGWCSLAALAMVLVCAPAGLFTQGDPDRGRLRASRQLTGVYRKLPGRWGGTAVPSPYLRDRSPGEDPATRRDLLFLALEPLVALVLLLVPSAMAWYGLFGLLAPGSAALLGGDHSLFYGAVWDSPVMALPAGLLLYYAALLLAGPASRLHAARWLPRLLGPAPSVAAEVERRRLAERVEELTETRLAAVDSREAELRRIERDLHDGAQARLVAMGLALGALETLMETDLERARELVRQTRENSARALIELRALVRGIHPPVLAERGLVDALRALALDAPLEAEVDADGLTGRPEGPIEAALYFAVAELLTNAARHGDATHARVALRHTGGLLRCTVWDDGGGGAREEDGPVLGAGGSGLRGIRRRLSAFDGTLGVQSPAGGPTLVTMELPCVLSSRKTSSSSGKGSALS
ncbi:sensor histidine kinase [Streptomyces sp. MMG1121]|uniref:sensor histidine kinase n=1 Tax=Streptomyces sp. MMG1121 TaxID=1415544 RepID=UPI0006AF4BA6|nr:sensor histidine kinase [Streptomyces sp. MMG1121]KOV63559.1 histidine kinase [Streptomyces sp. MMG1121]